MSQPSGSIMPSPDLLNEYPEGKFALAILAAKRAKQLKDGAPPLVRVESNHPLTIALAEIAAGKIKPILGKIDPAKTVVDSDTRPMLGEDLLTPELGILLPALDESEAELIAAIELSDEEHDLTHEEHVEAAPASLSDLLGDADEEVAVTAAVEEETLSLSDIADQEELEAEEAETQEA